jgi:hypothetical protein
MTEEAIPARAECALCGVPSDSAPIDLHHVVPRSQAPERIYDVTNIIPLCRRCHERAHTFRIAYDREQDRLLVYLGNVLQASMPAHPRYDLNISPRDFLSPPTLQHVEEVRKASIPALRDLWSSLEESQGALLLWRLLVVMEVYTRVAWQPQPLRALQDILGIPEIDAQRQLDRARFLFETLPNAFPPEEAAILRGHMAAVVALRPKILDALAHLPPEKVTPELVERVLEAPHIALQEVKRELPVTKVEYLVCPHCHNMSARDDCAGPKLCYRCPYCRLWHPSDMYEHRQAHI